VLAAIAHPRGRDFQPTVTPLNVTTVDFAIITALEEERDAVLAHIEGWRKLEKDGLDTHTWYEAIVPTRRKDHAAYRVVVTSLAGMGPLMATAKAQAVVARWHPNNVLLVGIACGMPPPDTALGDVLVSRQVADYTLGKVFPDGRREIRWEVYRSGANLLDGALNLTPEEWIPLLTPAIRPTPGVPSRHCGVIASGGDVVSNADLIAGYREDWPKLIGIEMESGGTAAGLNDTSHPPEFLMIKGVSDFGEGKDDVKAWRPSASDAAAAFAVALIRAGTGPAVPKTRRRFAALASLAVLTLIAIALSVAWVNGRRAAAAVLLDNQGVEAMKAGRRADARRAFDAALRANPQNAAVQMNLAVLDATEKNLPDAITHAETAVRIAPEVALYQFNLGVLLSRGERFEEALACLRRAVEIEPRNAKAYNEIGNIHLKLGRPADARKALVAGLAEDPRFAPLSKNLARVALAEGHADEAVRLLDVALANYGNDASARAEATYWLAVAEQVRGSRVASCVALKRFQVLDPERVSEVAPDAQQLAIKEGCNPWP